MKAKFTRGQEPSKSLNIGQDREIYPSFEGQKIPHGIYVAYTDKYKAVLEIGEEDSYIISNWASISSVFWVENPHKEVLTGYWNIGKILDNLGIIELEKHDSKDEISDFIPIEGNKGMRESYDFKRGKTPGESLRIGENRKVFLSRSSIKEPFEVIDFPDGYYLVQNHNADFGIIEIIEGDFVSFQSPFYMHSANLLKDLRNDTFNRFDVDENFGDYSQRMNIVLIKSIHDGKVDESSFKRGKSPKESLNIGEFSAIKAPYFNKQIVPGIYICQSRNMNDEKDYAFFKINIEDDFISQQSNYHKDIKDAEKDVWEKESDSRFNTNSAIPEYLDSMRVESIKLYKHLDESYNFKRGLSPKKGLELGEYREIPFPFPGGTIKEIPPGVYVATSDDGDRILLRFYGKDYFDAISTWNIVQHEEKSMLSYIRRSPRRHAKYGERWLIREKIRKIQKIDIDLKEIQRHSEMNENFQRGLDPSRAMQVGKHRVLTPPFDMEKITPGIYVAHFEKEKIVVQLDPDPKKCWKLSPWINNSHWLDVDDWDRYTYADEEKMFNISHTWLENANVLYRISKRRTRSPGIIRFQKRTRTKNLAGDRKRSNKPKKME